MTIQRMERVGIVVGDLVAPRRSSSATQPVQAPDPRSGQRGLRGLRSSFSGGVTVSRSEPDLNPYGPDLRKRVASDSSNVRSYNVSAGQGMIMMCPRPDTQLNYMIDIALTTEFTLATGSGR
jgi:hypothetical protein